MKIEPLKLGQCVGGGRYQLEQYLKRNEFILIAKGQDLHNKEKVIVKQYIDYDSSVECFSRQDMFMRIKELQLSPRLIITPISMIFEQKAWIQIRPFVDGVDLFRFVAYHSQSLPVNTIISIVCYIAEAVGQIHRNNLIYGDLKPSNIVMTKGLRPVLVDMDTCREVQKSVGREDNVTITGTPGYMAPEIYMHPGTEDARADLYSLGVILYFMLTRRLPIDVSSHNYVMLRYRTLYETPILPSVFNPDVSQKLDAICEQLLAKLPQDRFQSANEVYRCLNLQIGNSCNTSPSSEATFIAMSKN